MRSGARFAARAMVLSAAVMLKQRYDKRLSLGIIAASGTLGILIRPRSC